jgi:hypothetical protein
MVYDIIVRGNAFIAPEKTDSPSYGMISENPDSTALKTEDNLFFGKIDEEVIIGS